MPRRLANDLLLGLVLAQVATGLAGWALPVASVLPLYAVHRALGVGLVLVLVWKQAIARGSWARRSRTRPRDHSVVRGLLAAVALLGSLAFGLAWTLGLVTYDSLWGYSPLNLHVFLALALMPLLLWHALGRLRVNRSSPPAAGRRTALRLGGLALATVLGWQAVERIATGVQAAGSRLTTGSRHAGSYSGNAFPITSWLFDPIQEIDPAGWSVAVQRGGLDTGGITWLELSALPGRSMDVVLDCTSGWWSGQVWEGVSLGDVLTSRGVPAGTSVTVTSATGHSCTLPFAEARDALLATRVGGQPLSAGHGAPVRLVAPGRRGYQWVKWVSRIQVD